MVDFVSMSMQMYSLDITEELITELDKVREYREDQALPEKDRKGVAKPSNRIIRLHDMLEMALIQKMAGMSQYGS